MPTIKLSDHLVRSLVDAGVTQAFLVTGGGAMHLNDAIAREPRMRWVANHHEQGSAIAAEGYARVTGRPALVQVTTGPGGINALNGVFGAYTDSIPMVVVSGQVKRETLASLRAPSLRQLGDQEVDILAMARGVTKYAALVDEPSRVRAHLERALHEATSGRPGPVWLDIPIDVQAALVDPDALAGFVPVDDVGAARRARVDEDAARVADRLLAADRPVVLVGTGVHAARAEASLRDLVGRLGAPLVASWTGVDLAPNAHPLYAGRAGTIGDRAGNFAVQNADCVLVLGSRLNVRQVSYAWPHFARAAFKIQVDVDPRELDKPMVVPDLPVEQDLADFIPALARELGRRAHDSGRFASWVGWCRERVLRYPVLLDRHAAVGERMSPYRFVHRVFEQLGDDDVVVCGNGTASVVPYQVGTIREGQRMFANSGDASMGYDLPAAIGAAVARGGRRVVCFAGDGSLMMNVQELATLRTLGLPVKIFVLDNDGYVSMRQTQHGFFGGRLIGEGPASGVGFPDFEKLAAAFGLRYERIVESNADEAIARALGSDDPVVAHASIDRDQGFEPKLASKALPDGRIVSPPLEDMAPFLERDELLANMLVPTPE